MSSNDEKHQKTLKEFSDANIDTYVQTSTFKGEVEDAVRAHIRLELKSWYFFNKLASDCCRANVALHGFGALWKRSAVEALADAEWLDKYLIQRGGICKPEDIPAPKSVWPDEPVDPVQPVYEALNVEKAILEDCHRLCAVAAKAGDIATATAIESRFLCKETRHIKDLGDLLQQCVRVSKQVGHGLYHLDRELRLTHGVTPWGCFNEPDASDKIHKCTVEEMCKGGIHV